MITIEERNLFGKWQAWPEKTFDSLVEAHAWCVEMSDLTGVAYRVLQDGQVIDAVDLEAGFFALGRSDQDAESDRAAAEEYGIPQFDDQGLFTGYKPPSDPSDI